MIDINGKRLCKHCFSELTIEKNFCSYCSSEKNTDKYPTALSEGEILAGRYLVGKVLGKGGFGVTYLCYDSRENKKVAVKEYLPDSLSHRNKGETSVSCYGGEKDEYFKSGAKKFFDEAKLVSKFNGNPNIISVYEFFFENNTAYFVMEYLEGFDLKKYIALSGGHISESKALYVAMKITEALMIVHCTEVLHRDISPDNIFICKNGEIKLIDFGAARQVLGEASKSLSVILKQGFAPLEQYKKKGNQGPWTDIYALGATLYYSITGEPLDDAMSRIDNEELESDKISPEFRAVLEKMLAVRYEDRYQNTFELKMAFAGIAGKVRATELFDERFTTILTSYEDDIRKRHEEEINKKLAEQKKIEEEKKKAETLKQNKKLKKISIGIISAACVLGILIGFLIPIKPAETVVLGSYPQSRVTSDPLIEKLNNQFANKELWYSFDNYSGDGTPGSMKKSDGMLYTDVVFEGNKYRGVLITEYRPKSTDLKATAENSFQDDNGYMVNELYWFLYEDLTWRIVDKEKGVLFCETVIDAQAYSNLEYIPSSSENADDTSVYMWLNNDFADSAFNSSEKNMFVVNSRLSGSENNIFFLSKEMLSNDDYGFFDNGDPSDLFSASVSDYAKCTGARTYAHVSGNDVYENAYWLLSISAEEDTLCFNCDSNGVLQSIDWNSTSNGIRPAITINPERLEELI